MFKVLTSVHLMEEPPAEHGPWHNDEITALVNGGNAGWDPRPNVAGRGDCPDKYCGYMPNQKEGMLPAVRAEAGTPMSDERFRDLMPPAWTIMVFLKEQVLLHS